MPTAAVKEQTGVEVGAHVTVDKTNHALSAKKQANWKKTIGTGGAGKAEGDCQPGQKVKDKSQRKWHGLIKVPNRIVNLSVWHCSEGDKGVEGKKKKTL